MNNVGRYIMLWCIAVAYGLLLYSGSGGDYMGIAEWVAIGVALLGVAGGIWMQVVQFKKDAQRIESVNKTSGEVKNDTTEMKPILIQTSENVKEMSHGFLERKTKIDETMGRIEKLAAAKEVDDAIRQRVSSSIDNPQYIQNAVKLVYEKNAELEREKSELINEKMQLEAELTMLQNEKAAILTANEILQNENQTLKKELYTLKERNNPGRGR